MIHRHEFSSLSAIALSCALALVLTSCGGSAADGTDPLPSTPPAAPTGLTATSTNGSISLAWNASAGAIGYKVSRGTASGGPYSTTVAIGLPATNYNDASVVSGTAHFYVISAMNLAGESAASAQASATTAAAAPTGLTAIPGNGSVSLAWNASLGAISYKLSRATGSGGPYPTTVATGLTTTAYTDSSVTNATTYSYVVTAVNTGGESTASAQATTTPAAPPAAPTGLTATPGNGSVVLTWNSSAGAISYTLSRGTVSGGPYSTTVGTTGTTNTAYTDFIVTNGTTYYYVVTAASAAGESTKSAQASATPMAPPAAPTSLTATAGDGSVSLAWNASAGATSYTILRAPPNGGAPIATGIVATNYTDNTAANGTNLVYWIQAVNAAGASPISNAANAFPTSCVTLVSGLNFQYLGTGSNSNTGFSLSAIVIDADRVFWFDYNASLGNSGGAIRSVAKTGGAVTVIASGLGGVNAFTVDGNNVYWTEFNIADGNGTVKQAPKAGGAPITLASDFFPNGIAVDLTTVFYSGGGGASTGTKRVPIGGGAVTNVTLGAGSFAAASLALDATFIYGVDLSGGGIPTGKAQRVPKAGGTVEVLATGLENAFGAVLDNGSLYWAEIADPGKIGKAPRAGGGATYLATGLRGPHNVALDDTFAYFDGGAPVNGVQNVAKVPLAGGPLVAAADPGCYGQYVAVDATHIFISQFGNAVAGAGKILRSRK